MSACGLCGHTPACGSAEIDGTRYCHGDPMTDFDLEALQAAATFYDLDPTEPGAEEWLRGSLHYGQTRLRLALQQTSDILWDQLARGFSAFTSALTRKETP